MNLNKRRTCITVYLLCAGSLVMHDIYAGFAFSVPSVPGIHLLSQGISLMSSLFSKKNDTTSVKNSTIQKPSFWNKVKQEYKFIKSIAIFYPSFFYIKMRDGEIFSFNQILNSNNTTTEKPLVSVNTDNTIITIYDGKKTPLILGSIPYRPEHLSKIKQAYNTDETKTISLFTFNEAFEQRWSGLEQIKKKDKTLSTYVYPTTDFSPPSFIDLLRVVRDLKNRDDSSLAYVHCMAGSGRSVVAVAAYLLYICKQAGVCVEIEVIEQYLKSKRKQVSLNTDHRKGLAYFAQQLKNTQDFETLYNTYEDIIKKRDQDVQISYFIK